MSKTVESIIDQIAILQMRIDSADRRLRYFESGNIQTSPAEQASGIARRINVQGDTYYLDANGDAVLNNLRLVGRAGIGGVPYSAAGLDIIQTTTAYLYMNSINALAYTNSNSTLYVGSVDGFAKNLALQLRTNDVPRVSIDSTGNVVVTTSLYVGAATGAVPDQKAVIVRSGNYCGFAIDTNDSGSTFSILFLRKSDSTTIGTIAATGSGDELGEIQFLGGRSGGGSYGFGSRIKVVQNGAAGATYLPADLYLEACNASGLNPSQMVLHTTGHVGFFTQSRAAAHINAGGQTIATGTTTVVDFDVEDHDQLGEYDSGANPGFTPAIAGWYQVSACILFDSQTWTTGKQCYLHVYVNGSIYALLDFKEIEAGASIYVCLKGSCTVYSNAQKIDIRVTHNEGDSQTINSTAELSWVRYHKLS